MVWSRAKTGASNGKRQSVVCGWFPWEREEGRKVKDHFTAWFVILCQPNLRLNWEQKKFINEKRFLQEERSERKKGENQNCLGKKSWKFWISKKVLQKFSPSESDERIKIFKVTAKEFIVEGIFESVCPEFWNSNKTSWISGQKFQA